MRPGMSKECVPEILAAADVTTSLFDDVPAMQANSANKFFDALAAGCPIALNYDGWQADLVRQFDIGMVLPHGDLKAAADGLLSGLADRTWLRMAGDRAREVGLERFDRDKLAVQFECVLREAVDQHKAHRGRPVPFPWKSA